MSLAYESRKLAQAQEEPEAKKEVEKRCRGVFFTFF